VHGKIFRLLVPAIFFIQECGKDPRLLSTASRRGVEND
jgi:hypothetical protein